MQDTEARNRGKAVVPRACHDRETYLRMHKHSIEDPASFWGDVARDFYWDKQWDEDHVRFNFDVRKGPVHVEWFRGARTNLAYNCLDRNIQRGLGDWPAVIWEGNDPAHSASLTFKEATAEVCRLSNWLSSMGVRPGDAVIIYAPMVPQLQLSMLACARIGAVHCVVFGGFSAESLAQRIVDCKARVVITAPAAARGNKVVRLKEIADDAFALCAEDYHHTVDCCLLIDMPHVLTKARTPVTAGRDHWYSEVIPQQPPSFVPAWVDAEHPLFVLHTSGSTGKPKGIQHSTAGYMVYGATTYKYVFAMRPKDVFFGTADGGWIMGHTGLYGPLLNGCTIVIYEGVPAHPSPARLWHIIERNSVHHLYTAPTVIRALMAYGDEPPQKHRLSSLRVLGTAGEVINPEAWSWYSDVIGSSRCTVADSWWQTETGSVMLTPLPGCWPEKPGSVTLPMFGISPVVLDPSTGRELQGACKGVLCIRQAWPSTARSILNDKDRYEETYFTPYPGYYFTGDGVERDSDGYLWITGRVDDVINVSGHRVGTAEVESALMTHDACAESAVVGYRHPVKGTAIYAYVRLKAGRQQSKELQMQLKQAVRTRIGGFAVPDAIQWARAMPATRSGKILRRILRKVANGETDYGDTMSLADPSSLDDLVRNGPKRRSKL